MNAVLLHVLGCCLNLCPCPAVRSQLSKVASFSRSWGDEEDQPSAPASDPPPAKPRNVIDLIDSDEEDKPVSWPPSPPYVQEASSLRSRSPPPPLTPPRLSKLTSLALPSSLPSMPAESNTPPPNPQPMSSPSQLKSWRPSTPLQLPPPLAQLESPHQTSPLAPKEGEQSLETTTHPQPLPPTRLPPRQVQAGRALQLSERRGLSATPGTRSSQSELFVSSSLDPVSSLRSI